MRRRYVQIDGVLHEVGERAPTPRVEIVPDFDRPYKSMITGEMITSRAKHREHLRRHGYFEVGNDPSLTRPRKAFPDAAPQQRKELLIAQVNAMTHKQFKEAGRRDLERLRWQTNGIPDPLKEI